jgi:hypothetical protein
MGLRDQIRRRWEGWKHPLDAIWKWAKRPKRARQKSNRFKAAQAWAADKVELARKHKLGGVREWIKRRKIYRRKKAFYDHRADKHAADQIAYPESGVVVPDRPWNPSRKPVAAWMVPKIDAAWNKGWRGIVNSGYRSPEYSTQLCYQICGAPSCPGTCAGASSNHTKAGYPNGAVDVSNPSSFAAASRAAGTGLWNALGSADPWHFSMSGR